MADASHWKTVGFDQLTVLAVGLGDRLGIERRLFLLVQPAPVGGDQFSLVPLADVGLLLTAAFLGGLAFLLPLRVVPALPLGLGNEVLGESGVGLDRRYQPRGGIGHLARLLLGQERLADLSSGSDQRGHGDWIGLADHQRF